MVGVLIQTLLIVVGIYFSIMELNQCLMYFDVVKNNLRESYDSSKFINSLILKILFFDKITLSNMNKDLIPFKQRPFDLNDLIGNNSIKNTTLNYLKKKKYNFTKFLKPYTIYESDLYSENIIYEFVLNIFYPILFLCFLSLVKTVLFQTKNGTLKIFIYLSIMIEYFNFKYSPCQNNSNYFCVLFPAYVGIILYLVFIGIRSYNKMYKNISIIDKFYYLISDGLIFIGTFSTAYALFLGSVFGEDKISDIRFYFMAGIMIYTIGNCHGFGNLYIEYFLFGSFKMELFPPLPQENYYEVLFHYSLYEKFENSQSHQVPSSVEEPTEREHLTESTNNQRQLL